MILIHSFTLFILLFKVTISLSSAIPFATQAPQIQPYPSSSAVHHCRAMEPSFPANIPSCPICQQNWNGIQNCASAAPVFANFSMIIYNPGAFIGVIECACTDTFTSTYPQCVDCFEQTNQTSLLDTPNAPSVVDGMRKVCALASTLLGGVAYTDGEATPTSSVYLPPSAKASPNSVAGNGVGGRLGMVGLVILAQVLGV